MNHIVNGSVSKQLNAIRWKIEKNRADLGATWIGLVGAQVFFLVFALTTSWKPMQYFAFGTLAVGSLIATNLALASINEQHEEIGLSGSKSKLRFRLSYPFFLLQRDADGPVSLKNLFFMRQTIKTTANSISAVKIGHIGFHAVLEIHFKGGKCLRLARGSECDVREIASELTAMLRTKRPG